MTAAGALARLRQSFEQAAYTTDGVADLLGPAALGALSRNETVPAVRRTDDGSPLATLVRLFLLQRTVDESTAGRALPVVDAIALGVLERAGGDVRARLDVRPYGEAAAGDPPWWVVSDLGTGLDGVTAPLRADHVLGVGGASTTLAQITSRRPVGRALDLGTGCGVQALHLSRHAARVVGTDVLPRALRLARMTAALSGVDLDLREGSLWDPVDGEELDLVVSNPPFVVAPEGAAYTYRDSGLGGDEACARLVRGATAHLAPGGVMQLLANWVHREGEDWRDRVGGWLPDDADALVVQREVLDPAEYVALWLRDSGESGGADYAARYDAWLAALERDGVEGVGLGWIALRRTGSRPSRDLRDWPHPVTLPLGDELVAALDRGSWLAAASDQDVLAARLRAAADVVLEQTGEPGAEDPQHLVLRRGLGLRAARRVGTVEAALVGACDGTLTVAAILQAVASLTGGDVDLGGSVRGVRELVQDGFLVPDGSGSALDPV